MEMTATAAVVDSFTGRFAFARGRLASAQKSTASVPAYLRFVNRKAGGVLACLAYAARLTPTQVTALSALSSLAGIVVLVTVSSSGLTGIVVGLLLLLGYALDSADGQLARVRGGGTKAGEWLDHTVDIAKMTALHSAVAVAVVRYFHLDSLLYLGVPIVFLVVNATQFFALALRDQLMGRPPRSESAAPSSVFASFLLLPLDHGALCLMLLILGWHAAFLIGYGFLAFCATLFAVRSLTKTYRGLLVSESGASQS
jgi:phosphatidylglycerophosphate synthase